MKSKRYIIKHEKMQKLRNNNEAAKAMVFSIQATLSAAMRSDDPHIMRQNIRRALDMLSFGE